MRVTPGQRFGRLVAIAPTTERRDRKVVWRFSCDCGEESLNIGTVVSRGDAKSCGCLLAESRSARRIHGMSDTAAYRCWRNMRSRCENENVKSYADYGGRGITVCARWMSFTAFIEDMGQPPSSDAQIDRIDNDGDYTPENCRWVSREQNASHKRNTHLVTAFGRTLHAAAWSRETGIKYTTLLRRLRAGEHPESAMTRKVA